MDERRTARHAGGAVRRRRGRGRALLTVTAALGLAAVTGACGSTATAKTTSKTAHAITLTEQDYYTTNPGLTVWKNMFAEYEKTHPGVTIKRTVIPGTSYMTKVLEEASSGSLPDVLMLDNPYVPEVAKTGVLMALPQTGDLSPSDYDPSVYKSALYKGKLYAVPFYTNTIALFYNKKMLKAAHVTPPKTWAQLLVDAKKLTTSSHHGITFQGRADHDDILWEYEPFLWSNGGHIRDLDSKAAIQAITEMRDLVAEGAASKSVVTYNQEDEVEQFIAGKAAMMINGSWEIPTLAPYAKTLSYGVVPIPVRVPGQTVKVPLGAEFWAVPKTTPAKEKAALKLLEWMSAPKQVVKESVGMGYIAVVKAASAEALKEEGPLTKVFASEIASGGRTRTEYVGTKYRAISDAIDPLLQDAVLGTMSPAAAMKAAAAKVSSILHS